MDEWKTHKDLPTRDLRGMQTSIDLELTPEQTDEWAKIAFGGEVPEQPKSNLHLSYRVPVPAGLSKTQKLIKRKTPRRRPEWVWQLSAYRSSLKNGHTFEWVLYDVSFMIDPQNGTSVVGLANG